MMNFGFPMDATRKSIIVLVHLLKRIDFSRNLILNPISADDCLFLVGSFHICYAYTAYDAMVLQNTLSTNYSTKVRPSSTTVVDVTFGMMHITELNIVNQQLHVVGFLLATWIDDRLTWVTSDHGNMDFIYIRLSDIWSPPLVLNNAADEIQMINDDSDLSSVVVYLSDDGSVIWLAPANFVAQCTINIRYYPFDSQMCFFVVSSWLYIANHLQIGGSGETINMDLYEENGEWDITSSSVENITRILMSHPLPGVKFTLFLKRKYSYYLMNMILPVIVLALMAPFVFILPVESGEKMGYCLTILLSLSVVMTLVSDSIPPTSTHICVLSVYLLLTFIICSLETLLTVLTCRIHEFHQKGYKMGPKLHALTIFLAKITRSHKLYEKEHTGATSKIDLNIEKSDLKIKESVNSTIDKAKGRAWVEDKKEDIIECEADDNGFEEFALVFDKFNFFLFSIITIAVTVVCMVILRVGGAQA